MNLRCSHVIVTGGGSGIGKAIAKRLIDEGIKVVIAGQNINKLEKAKEEISSDRLFCLEWDIANVDICDHQLKKAEEMMGGFDGLANCAALGTS